MEKLYLDGENSNTEVPHARDLQFLEELHITKFDEIIPLISELLPKLPHLNTLSICHSVVTMDSAQTIANFIANSTLLKFELLQCRIEDDPFVLLMNSIEKSSLRTLNFSNYCSMDAKIMAIVDVLKKSSLTKLSFVWCEFEHDGLIIMMRAIEESKLKTLILKNACFDGTACAIVAGCIGRSKLTKLSLRSTTFNENEPHVILNAIKRSSLKILDVRNVSNLSFDAINHLILHKNFTKFRFSERSFSTRQRRALIDSIQENSSLEHIHFDGHCGSKRNIFTDQLVTKMCDLLRAPRFKSLYFDSCSLPNTMPTFKRIIDAIKCTSIVSLKFSGGPYIEEMMIIVRDLLENYQFEKLKLFGLANADADVEQILPSIRQSSIIKFNAESVRTNAKQQNEIESILRSNRQRIHNYANIKSARH